MKTIELFNNAIDHWKNNKGIGTALIPFPLNDKLIVLGVLQRIYTRSPTCKTVIITSTFKDRQDMIEFLTNQEEAEDNNKEFKELINNKHILILTANFIQNAKHNINAFLSIWYRPDSIYKDVLDFVSNCKFKLVVCNKFIKDYEERNLLYSKIPLLEDFKQKEVEQARLSTPVEETVIRVDIPDDSEERKLLDYQNSYISTSVSIFGSFDIMNQARIGNKQLNISAAQICNQLAEENGWNPNLNMNIEFNIQVDELYNPMNLYDRAAKTYEIIRNRSNLLSNYEGKLDSVLDIVNNNKNKKILIINKSSDFANKVTDYLNNMSDTIICGNYHTLMENIPAVDINGTPLYYKSGENKGKRKMMGERAQKTLNEQKFNKGLINVLSCNSAPDKDLSIIVDVVIITSPLCETIKSYLYRLSNLFFTEDKIRLYSIYCGNSLEETKQNDRIVNSTNKIITSVEKEINDFVVEY
uniref:Uncharacterized protein n=1 Tax=Geladintestivirus 2 TaxID=3233134 RepID=A0AAU8MIB6_9CAUD